MIEAMCYENPKQEMKGIMIEIFRVAEKFVKMKIKNS